MRGHPYARFVENAKWKVELRRLKTKARYLEILFKEEIKKWVISWHITIIEIENALEGNERNKTRGRLEILSKYFPNVKYIDDLIY